MVTLVIHNQKHSEADIYAATNALLSKIREVLMGLSVFIKIPTIHSAIIALDILVEEFERTGKYSVSIDLILGDLVLLNQEITGLYAKNGNISEQKEYKKYIDSIQAYIEFILENNRHFNVAQLSLIAQIFPNATAQYALRSRNAALIVMSTPDIYHRFERPSDVARIYYKHKYDYELASLVAHNVPAAINFELALNANHELKAARESVALLAGLKGNSEQRARTYLHFLTKAEGANPQETESIRKRNLNTLIKGGKKLHRIPLQVMNLNEKAHVLNLLDPVNKAKVIASLTTPSTGFQKLVDASSWVGRGLRWLGFSESVYNHHKTQIAEVRQQKELFEQDKILPSEFNQYVTDLSSSLNKTQLAALRPTMPFELWSLLAIEVNRKEKTEELVAKAKTRAAKRATNEASKKNSCSTLPKATPVNETKSSSDDCSSEKPQFSLEENSPQQTAPKKTPARSGDVTVALNPTTIEIQLPDEAFSEDSHSTDNDRSNTGHNSPMRTVSEDSDSMSISASSVAATPVSVSPINAGSLAKNSNAITPGLLVPYSYLRQALFNVKTDESKSENPVLGSSRNSPEIRSKA